MIPNRAGSEASRMTGADFHVSGGRAAGDETVEDGGIETGQPAVDPVGFPTLGASVGRNHRESLPLDENVGQSLAVGTSLALEHS